MNSSTTIGASLMDMYDRPQFVAPAVAKLTAFFGLQFDPAGGSQ
jgi:hypothetical protein